ncbi:MAG: hypothetical protein JSV69_12995 [Chloroflexota bacterium]|jgi:uncharacterized spore protein YtfJ|nr:MAG: hypothetical protein JSV69_12995 [Chloroflexota bacterium]UCF29447.1 MAG: hypothetical protein JSW42_07175 [Chloroflexota bacterium]
MDKVVKGPGESGDIDLHQTFEDINPIVQTFIESASVDKVYGQPVEVGETKIIPTSENLVVLGFGAGAGYGRGDFEGEESPNGGQGTGEGAGGGGGGGGRTLSRPVAVVIASPEGVRVEPVADRTKVIMAAITAAGFVAGMFLRMSRGPKGL